MKLPEYYCYPAILGFDPNEEEISVFFPDLDVATSGVTESDALSSAQELLALVMYGLEEDNEPIPSPSKLSDLVIGQNEYSTLVKAYMPTIRLRENNRSVTKTVTIPAWMDAKAKELNIPFSQVLQDGINKIIEESQKEAVGYMVSQMIDYKAIYNPAAYTIEEAL